MLKRISNAIAYRYKLFILRDPFLRNVRRWVKDNADTRLRYHYPLHERSVVIDVGGYHGDFAAVMNERYGCSVYVFEPVAAFYATCVERFKDNPKIHVFNYGLGAIDASIPMSVAGDASAFSIGSTATDSPLAELRAANTVFANLGLERVDLIKINIEGGEYDLLPALIERGWIERIGFVQVQFHNFVTDADMKRNDIRRRLAQTHREMWNYDFVWESWCLA